MISTFSNSNNSDKYVDTRAKRSKKNKEKRSRKESRSSRRHMDDASKISMTSRTSPNSRRRHHMDDASKSSHSSYTSPSSSRETSPIRSKSILRAEVSALVHTDDDESSLAFTYNNDLMSYADSKYVLRSSSTLEKEDRIVDIIDSTNGPYRDDLEDPLASNFMDEYDGELKDVAIMRTQIQDNFNNMGDTAKTHRRSPNRCWFYLVSVCVILVACTTGIVVMLLDHSDSMSTQATSSSMTEAPMVVNLPSIDEPITSLPLPVGDTVALSSACAATTLEKEGTDECLALCSVAECCWNSGIGNCASTVHHQCSAYTTHCFQLNGYPLSTDHSFSTSASTPAADEANQLAQQPTTSAGTATSAETKLPFPVADTTALTSACSVSTLKANGSVECFDQCSVAECCWKAGAASCASSVNHQCSTYTTHCLQLNSRMESTFSIGSTMQATTIPAPKPSTISSSSSSSTSVVPTAPSYLGSVCAAIGGASAITGDIEACIESCAKAMCCWKDGVRSCASAGENTQCRNYADACSALNLHRSP